MVALFSYGTLQQREVQLATYGREIEGAPDALLGYRLSPVVIDDPHVVDVSGKDVHTIAIPSGDATDRVQGIVLLLSEDELRASDAYETDPYSRVEVSLESGCTAFAYVASTIVAPS